MRWKKTFRRQLMALLATLFAAALSVTAQNEAAPSEWLRVQRWTGTFTITVGEEKKIELKSVGPGTFTYHSGHWNIGGPFIVDRNEEPQPGDTASSWHGRSMATGALVGEYGIEPSQIKQGYVANGSPNGFNGIDFQLSTESGKYDFQIELEFDGSKIIDDTKVLEAIHQLKGEARPFFEGFWKGIVPQNTSPEKFHISASFENIPLPDKFGPINGSRDFTFVTNFHEPGPLLRGTVQWTLSPAPASPYEVVLEPEGYNAWIPEGNIDQPAEPGNDIAIKATVFKKGTRTPVAAKVNLMFKLQNVSNEPGVCTNWPDSGSSEAPDLKILADRNVDLEVPKDSEARTTRQVSSAQIVVSSFDFGAHGLLQVTATDENEAPVPVIFRSRREAPVPIPKDEDENGIADAWDKAHGSAGQEAEWDDDDDPPGQRRDGDGYTVFEEYRGFMTLGGYVRTEPKKKDLFVHDPDGLIKQFYEPTNAAKLALHYVDTSMMRFNGEARNPDNRWVNFNSRSMYARQYALYVKSWTMMTDENDSSVIVGEASDKVLQDQLNGVGPDSYAQPLKCMYVVKVSPKVARKMARGHSVDPGQQQNLYNIIMESSVIHEIGHAIGIRHHDPDVSGGIGECAMRYTSSAEDEHGQIPRQTRYCTKNEIIRTPGEIGGTEDNPQYQWKERPADNCFGQIDIKSDPGPCPTVP